MFVGEVLLVVSLEHSCLGARASPNDRAVRSAWLGPVTLGNFNNLLLQCSNGSVDLNCGSISLLRGGYASHGFLSELLVEFHACLEYALNIFLEFGKV